MKKLLLLSLLALVGCHVDPAIETGRDVAAAAQGAIVAAQGQCQANPSGSAC